jgi:hypothetical protein
MGLGVVLKHMENFTFTLFINLFSNLKHLCSFYDPM